jgi:predicted AlkP superfamily phosphohydrolase/phosphomutase
MLRRTLLSAFLASAFLAGDLVALTLLLNPGARLLHDSGALALSLFVPYSVAGGAVFSLIALALMSLGRPRMKRPPVEGLPWFASLSLVALVAAAGLQGWNLFNYRHSIPAEFVRALAGSTVGVAGAALVVLAVVVDAWLFPTRRRALAGPLVVLSAASSVVIPLALRPAPLPTPQPVPVATERVQPARRIVLIGIDGLGPSLVEDVIAREGLPVFARLLRRGSHGPLAALRPTEAAPVWTSIVTGRLPRDHGIKSYESYRLLGTSTPYDLLPKGAFVSGLERLGLASRVPVTSASRRCRTLWDALNAFGIQSGIVRFWGTYPTEKVQGFMLSSAFDALAHDPKRAAECLYPPDLLTEAVGKAVTPDDIDRAQVGQFVDLSVDLPDDRVQWRRDLVERALAPDLTFQRAGTLLRAAYDPPFFATRFYGLDVVGHAFMRFARPDTFGDVSPREVRRYGHVLDRYLAFLSEWVGELERSLGPGEILLVVSGYGMEPAPLWRRGLTWIEGGPAVGGTHDGAPDGLLLAVGDGIRAGGALKGASVLDVTPTILYLMGLPVARDMEGRVLTEMIDDDFARSHPVTYVPSYESLAVTPMVETPEETAPPLEENP